MTHDQTLALVIPLIVLTLIVFWHHVRLYHVEARLNDLKDDIDYLYNKTGTKRPIPPMDY